MKKSFFLLLLCCTLAFYTKAQAPLIQNYSSKAYKASPQNWDIVQDNRGVMYFANTNGLLEYDGSTWRMIQVPDNTVRSLGKDKNGTIYVGTGDDMGYLKADSTGKNTFISLKSLIPNGHRKFNTVWYIQKTPGYIYFITENDIYKFNIAKHSFHVIHLPGNSIWSFDVYNTVYIEDSDSGLVRLNNNNTLTRIRQADKAINAELMSMLPYKGHRILMATSNGGMFLYTPRSGKTPEPFTSSASSWMHKNMLYESRTISYPNDTNTYYAYSSAKGGIIIMNEKGAITQHIDKASGLRKNDVYYLYQDRQKALWAGLSDGIAKIDINLPFHFYDEHAHLKTPIYSICRYKGLLFAGTDLGLFYLNETSHQFVPVEALNGQCWKLVPTRKHLLADDGNNGLYFVDVVKNHKISYKAVYNRTSALMDIAVSGKDSSIIYCALYNGFTVCKISGNGVHELGRIREIKEPCRNVEVQSNGDVWIKAGTNDILRIVFPENNITKKSIEEATVKKYGTYSGLCASKYCRIVRGNNKLYFVSGDSIYNYNQITDHFRSIPEFRHQMGLRQHDPLNFKIGPKGNYWFPAALTISEKQHNNSFSPDTTSLKAIQDRCSAICFDSDNTVWLGNYDGLYHYFPAKKFQHKPINTLIRKVTLSANDSVVYDGTTSSLHLVLPFRFNSISFQYSAINFNFESKTRYQYKLEGYDNNWSDWTTNSQKEYTNLHEGKYVFYVRSITALGWKGARASYSFIILPPWYRTLWAYLLYILLFVAFVYLAIRISMYRLQAAKKRLELLVKERTREVVKKNKELEGALDQISQQKEEIEQKNKDITDSILYAKRIQGALLTSKAFLQEHLHEHFILFKPKDIVSGDFYWAHILPDNKLLVVTADCTGHGVPGAFMSMIGISLLNEIVVEKNIVQAHLILNELRESIVRALNPKGASDTGRDGMDITLCCYDFKNKQLEFASANNPLFLVRDNKLTPHKGDRFPVGIHDGERRPFTLQRIDLQKDDIIYTLSDGYADQFGGKEGKKLKQKTLQKIILDIHTHPLSEQKEKLDTFFEEWRGDLEQIDDILLMGIKIS